MRCRKREGRDIYMENFTSTLAWRDGDAAVRFDRHIKDLVIDNGKAASPKPDGVSKFFFKEEHLPIINSDSKIRKISVAKGPAEEENTLKHRQKRKNRWWSARTKAPWCEIEMKTKQYKTTWELVTTPPCHVQLQENVSNWGQRYCSIEIAVSWYSSRKAC